MHVSATTSFSVCDIASDNRGWQRMTAEVCGRIAACQSPFGFPGHLAETMSTSCQIWVRECRAMGKEQAARGRQVARVVVDVFESGEVVPYLQFPAGSPIDPGDGRATAAVRRASDALAGWQ